MHVMWKLITWKWLGKKTAGLIKHFLWGCWIQIMTCRWSYVQVVQVTQPAYYYYWEVFSYSASQVCCSTAIPWFMCELILTLQAKTKRECFFFFFSWGQLLPIMWSFLCLICFTTYSGSFTVPSPVKRRCFLYRVDSGQWKGRKGHRVVDPRTEGLKGFGLRPTGL